MQINELASPSKTVAWGLLAKDMTCRDDSVQLVIRLSKTDQGGRGVRVILLRGNCPSLCPVRAVEELLNIRLQVDGPLLWLREGVLLSKFQFVVVF